VAAGALALASLGASAWLLRPRAPRALAAASAWLAGTAACALALTSWSRIGWGEDRFGDADFARAVAAAVPREVPIVSVGPSIEMIVYYGDRRVRRVARDDLRSILERDPSTRVLAVRRDLGALGVDVGEPIVARGAEDRDAVLVAARGAR
jgi:hypothetical protein